MAAAAVVVSAVHAVPETVQPAVHPSRGMHRRIEPREACERVRARVRFRPVKVR